MKDACLLLANGETFKGKLYGANENDVAGEVVFSTGMTGYVESLTDPSYAGQILVFTYPLIGNYGVSEKDSWESKKIHARAVVMGELCHNWSHSKGEQSFKDWLEKQGVPFLEGVDTRALTKILRDHGSIPGVLTEDPGREHEFPDPNAEHLVAQVSPKERSRLGNGEKRIVAIDCGMKENIIRELLKLPATVDRVPFNDDFSQEDFDAVFVSNGPGNPEKCLETIQILKKVYQRDKPIFGICLGMQLMAIAAGAGTYKLTFGHRGHNQPCKDLSDGTCAITSQNHGYAVDEKTLPADWEISWENLNDGTPEGIAHKSLPYFAVQFHPEAAPGPTDTMGLFQKFWELIESSSELPEVGSSAIKKSLEEVLV